MKSMIIWLLRKDTLQESDGCVQVKGAAIHGIGVAVALIGHRGVMRRANPNSSEARNAMNAGAKTVRITAPNKEPPPTKAKAYKPKEFLLAPLC